jgi:predicted transcriptional regulator
MSVKIRRKRSKTAKEVGEKFGMSPRTVRRYMAEYRSDYEKRAAERRELAYKLRSQGKTWTEVGRLLDCSAEAARALNKRYLALQKQAEEQAKKEEKLDNFSLF